MNLSLYQADIRTASFHASIRPESNAVHAIPLEGIRMRHQASQARLKSEGVAVRPVPFRERLVGYSARYSLLEIGFVESAAEPCLYILDDGDILFLVSVDGILRSGESDNKVLSIVD